MQNAADTQETLVRTLSVNPPASGLGTTDQPGPAPAGRGATAQTATEPMSRALSVLNPDPRTNLRALTICVPPPHRTSQQRVSACGRCPGELSRSANYRGVRAPGQAFRVTGGRRGGAAVASPPVLLELGSRAYDLTTRSLVMGILNRTPDSFY